MNYDKNSFLAGLVVGINIACKNQPNPSVNSSTYSNTQADEKGTLKEDAGQKN